MAVSTASQQTDALLDAAGRLFSRFGYRKTTIDDIAREASIGKGTVYLHFESKELLAQAWMERKQDALFAELTSLALEPQDPLARIETFVTQRVLARHRLFERSQLAEECFAEMKELVRVSRDRMLKREQEFLAGLINQAIAANRASVTNADETARSFLYATNGLLPLSLLSQMPLDSVSDVLLPLVALLINSIAI
ncbi:MAG: TetR/AcrR family transcriptional regulator [Armatimonadetes bacterium]|nr:TetR/AcrR family transcriptional regulator [Armatimonadota bacterium]